MSLNPRLEIFLKDNLPLIKNDDYEELYLRYQNQRVGKTAWLTCALYNCGINPLLYVKEIPYKFLEGADPSEETLDNILSSENTFTIPNNIEIIGDDAFASWYDVKCVEIPQTVKYIKGTAFRNMQDLEYIVYEGTMDDWAEIDKDEETWNFACGNLGVIKCSDGDIYL